MMNMDFRGLASVLKLWLTACLLVVICIALIIGSAVWRKAYSKGYEAGIKGTNQVIK